jgi:hypothetical protein
MVGNNFCDKFIDQVAARDGSKVIKSAIILLFGNEG